MHLRMPELCWYIVSCSWGPSTHIPKSDRAYVETCKDWMSFWQLLLHYWRPVQGILMIWWISCNDECQSWQLKTTDLRKIIILWCHYHLTLSIQYTKFKFNFKFNVLKFGTWQDVENKQIASLNMIWYLVLEYIQQNVLIVVIEIWTILIRDKCSCDIH